MMDMLWYQNQQDLPRDYMQGVQQKRVKDASKDSDLIKCKEDLPSSQLEKIENKRLIFFYYRVGGQEFGLRYVKFKMPIRYMYMDT